MWNTLCQAFSTLDDALEGTVSVSEEVNASAYFSSQGRTSSLHTFCLILKEGNREFYIWKDLFYTKF